MSEPSDTDWAYAAGFVDGEGCIAVTRGFVPARAKYTYSVAVVVANRERAVLEWFKDLWGGWVVGVPRGTGRSRDCWNWRSPTGSSCEPFLVGIQPWLKIKRPQCDNALSMVAVLRRSRYTLGPKTLPPEWASLQEKHYWIQREMNHRGTDPFVAEPMHSPRAISRTRRFSEANER